MNKKYVIAIVLLIFGMTLLLAFLSMILYSYCINYCNNIHICILLQSIMFFLSLSLTAFLVCHHYRKKIVTDGLTKLFLRKKLYDDFNRIVKVRKEFAICYLDFSKFKSINDKYGHDAGDALLCSFSKSILELEKKGVIAYRWGGDEFVIVIKDSSTKFEKIVEEVLAINDNIIIVGDDTGKSVKINPRFNIGVSFFPYDSTDLETLIKNADEAMYYAKSKNSPIQHYSKIKEEIC